VAALQNDCTAYQQFFIYVVIISHCNVCSLLNAHNTTPLKHDDWNVA